MDSLGKWKLNKLLLIEKQADGIGAGMMCIRDRVWNSAVTNGIFVRFGDVELSHDEILAMAEQEH